MPFNIRYVLLIALICRGLLLHAQEKELGFTLGAMYYLGEMNQKQLANVSPAAGFCWRTTYQKRISWEKHLIIGTLNGADSLQSDPMLKNRNLSFRNRIIELGTLLEINYFEYKIGSKRSFATPYLFFGIAGFYSNPETNYNGEWYNLRDIGTEGQKLDGGKKYNLINFAIPLGIGFKVSLGNRLSFTVFSGFRKTFTDFIDDVSGSYADASRFTSEERVLIDRSLVKQKPNGTNSGLDRGNPNTKDWYNYTGFSLCFKTNKKQDACDLDY